MSKRKGIDEGRAKTLITAMLSLNARLQGIKNKPSETETLQELAIDSTYDPVTIETGETTTVFSGFVRRDVSNWSELLSAKKIEAGKICTLAELEDIISGKRTYKTGELSTTSLQLQGFLNLTARVISGLGRVKPKKAETRELNETLQICKDLREHGRELIGEQPKGEPFPIVFLNVFGLCGMTLWGVETRWKLDELPAQGGSFYMSGALLRNKTRPHNKGEQLTLWGQLETHELEAVTRRGEVSIQQVKENGVVRGLGGLTSSEHRLLLGLSQLLHEISKDTNDPTSKDYYTGEGTHPVKSDFTIGGGWPFFWIGTYELARICKGGGTVGGDDVKHIEATAKGLQEKTFLLSYQLQRQSKTKGRNTTIQDTFSTQDSIIKVLRFDRKERDNETGEVIQERTEICIALNPLFRHGIESYFVEWPSDTIERLEATKEGKRIPEAMFVLTDYLKTKSSNYTGKEETVTDRIDVQTMLEKLYPTYMEQNRRKRATEEAEKALSHALRAGFLSKWETDKGQAGQLQYILTIPKKW